MVNGVRILADEVGVSVDISKQLCFAFVRAWEVEFKRLSGRVMEGAGEEENDNHQRMITGIERRMTGAEAVT